MVRTAFLAATMAAILTGCTATDETLVTRSVVLDDRPNAVIYRDRRPTSITMRDARPDVIIYRDDRPGAITYEDSRPDEIIYDDDD
jgi:type IV pilus biogenesis protein CpaD/CtpE